MQIITIALPPDIEDRLKGEASRRGGSAQEYAQKIIIEHLPESKSNASLSDLFAEWDAEDHTDDPAEIARRNQEFEEFKEAMNRNRREMEGPGALTLFP
jgi:hypothetical protein